LISAGLLPMPLGFVMSSLIQELFGNRAGRLVTFIAVGLAVFTVLLVDTVVFEALAWYGLIAFQQIVHMAVASLVLKCILSVAVGPMASLSRAGIKAWLKAEQPAIWVMSPIDSR
jgi:uncharacterized PurR-regulated membrane protein YhhQ (DUF165 family)